MGVCLADYEGDYLWHQLCCADYRCGFLLWLLLELGAYSAADYLCDARLYA